MFKLKKAPKSLLLVLVMSAVLVIAGNIFLNAIYQPAQNIKFGVTFSPRFAGHLQLDWEKTYLRILDELKVKDLRLTSYWDILQPESEKYDFSQTDFFLNEAGKREVKVILVLGARQPRWPECHIPAWAANLSVTEKQRKILEFIQKTVERYKDNPSIRAWQVENEPLLLFGECDKPDESFLKQEVELVRGLSNKPIIMTDSGELGFWATSMSLSDIFGTTLYRQVYDKYLGYVTYPLPPYFYSLKSGLIRNIFAQNNSKTIVVELQAEPWLADGIFASAAQQARVLPVEKLKDYVNFAKKSGFDEVYLWGVEWWYFMAANGYPQYLEYAKTLF